MSIMSGGMRQTMELLDKLSVPQIQQGMKAGRYPAYLAIPAIELKTRMQKQFEQQKLLQQPSPKNMPTVAQQVMQEAQGMGSSMGAEIGAGVSGLPTNLPQEYAAGGIVAFDEGGEVERYRDGGDLTETQKKMRRLFGLPETLETPAAPQWNPFTNSYEPLTEAQKEQLAAGERAQRESYQAPRTERVAEMPSGMASEIGIPGFAGYEAPESTPRPPATPTAPAAAPAAKPPGAPPAAGPGAGAAPAGIAELGAAKPYRGPSASDIYRQQIYGTETEAGYLARSTARQRENEAKVAAAEGKVTGKAYEGLEESLRKEAEQFGADKEQAKNMAIFKAGLAMMAGTSRHALQNIGAGAMVGAEDYQKAAADIKKAQKEHQRMMAQIEQARRAEDMGNRDRAIARFDKAVEFEERRDQFLVNGLTSAGVKDIDRALEEYKTNLDNATRVKVANIQAGSREEVAMLRGLLSGEKGGMTQLQKGNVMRELERSPEVLAYEKKLREQKGSNADVSAAKAAFVQQLYEKYYGRSGGAPAGVGLTPEQVELVRKYLAQ